MEEEGNTHLPDGISVLAKLGRAVIERSANATTIAEVVDRHGAVVHAKDNKVGLLSRLEPTG